MGLCISTTSRLRSIESFETIGQGAISDHFQSTENDAIVGQPRWQSSPLTASIHVLDDDSLLNVFYIYRPFLLGEDDYHDDDRLVGGLGRWGRGRWWYNLAHVCRRWRNVVLGSASYLGISLVCTNGTPVADMLAHSPHLPLLIDYTFYAYRDEDITAKDKEGAILALMQRDRVRRIRFRMPVTSLQKLTVAMDDEYPILEHLIIMRMPLVDDRSPISTFPDTFQGPHLRHLALQGFTLPIKSRLLPTAVGLVTLCLDMVDPSTYLHPNTLLQWFSFVPQLETLRITFASAIPLAIPNDTERHLTPVPVMTPVILSNLHNFTFRGVNTYLETLIHRIEAPRLKKLQIRFFDLLPFSVPCLLQFMTATENLRFTSAEFEFSAGTGNIEVYPYEGAEMYALSIIVDCGHFDRQVSFVAQICNSLSPLFSAVEHLTLEHKAHSRSSEQHEADRTEWHKLLASFRNAKTLHIAHGLVRELSRCLELNDEGLPLELLPALQELTYFGIGNPGDVLTSFVDSRQEEGRPITLVRRSPSPDRSSSVPSSEQPSI